MSRRKIEQAKLQYWAGMIRDCQHSGLKTKEWLANHGISKDGKMDITLSNGIYVDSTNLKPAMQNKIRRMAAFSNPVFYKNRAIGTSNYDTSRWIYLGKDHLGGYIQIPRGLQDELIANIDKAGIEYTIDDERQQGRNINVEFNGELRPEQNKALKELTKHDNGILHAATAFGKTVVCSAVIAEKKVNTLILLESSALIEQWKDALNKFLIIDEELPQYKTKTGRLRTRKSLIGTLQGAHDSMTGIIDIAMAGSLCKKGEYHKLLNHYGLVLIDECHHCASETIANVLKEVKARYVYGVTATPKRGDGLEKINYMLIGPIRYSYTAKEKAMEQGIQHLVYPRFTRTVPPRGVINGKMHPNEAYDIIHNNDIRDEQIIEDIKNCVSAGRTPVVLSRYKDHSEKLYKRLKDYADHVFLMTGNNSKKEHKKILEQMHQVDKAESLILIATGSLVGEGYVLDKSRLINGQIFDEDYFEHLIAEIQEIRASERRFYQKITDIYATAVDYDKNSQVTREFYATVQNKMHYAVHGNTAAEVIVARADHNKEHMGLKSWKNAPDGKIVKTDVSIAKNYLGKEELAELNEIVTMYLDYATRQARRHIPMTMEDWKTKLDAFLRFNDAEVLQDKGKVTAAIAKEFAESEFEKYRVIQDSLYESDFDKLMNDMEKDDAIH